MKLTILGNAGPYPGPGGACSGYLVEDNHLKILLDCGTGALANLQKHVSIAELSHIIISHMHADHFLDLIPLRYYLALGVKGHRIALHLPPGGATTLLSVVSFLNDPGFFSAYFDVKEYSPDGLNIPGIKIEVARVPHYVPSYAIALIKDRKLTYSADCAPSDALVALAEKSTCWSAKPS